MARLENRKVAILTEAGFEQVELTSPKQALEAEGAKVDVISPRNGKIRAWNEKDWGEYISVDLEIVNVDPCQFHCLVLPGGRMNPDILQPQERCASTSNRNFEGRQGAGGRTHLVSPQMAAAAAIEGHFVDIREWK